MEQSKTLSGFGAAPDRYNLGISNLSIYCMCGVFLTAFWGGVALLVI